MKDSTTSNKKIGVYLVSIFLLLLVIPAVLAEFSVSKGVDVAGVCPRDTQVITDAVSNMGDISDFTISFFVISNHHVFIIFRLKYFAIFL